MVMSHIHNSKIMVTTSNIISTRTNIEYELRSTDNEKNDFRPLMYDVSSPFDPKVLHSNPIPILEPPGTLTKFREFYKMQVKNIKAKIKQKKHTVWSLRAAKSNKKLGCLTNEYVSSNTLQLKPEERITSSQCSIKSMPNLPSPISLSKITEA